MQHVPNPEAHDPEPVPPRVLHSTEVTQVPLSPVPEVQEEGIKRMKENSGKTAVKKFLKYSFNITLIIVLQSVTQKLCLVTKKKGKS